MFVTMRRYHRAWQQLSLTELAATTAVVDVREAAGGAIAVPSGSSITRLTFHAAVQPELAVAPLCDALGQPVTLDVEAGRIYALPEACYGVGTLAVTADAAGSVGLSLKG